MFQSEMSRLVPHFAVQQFEDCAEITTQSVKDAIYVLLRGSVSIIADERTHKHAKREVKRTRHRRKKAQEKREADIAAGLIEDTQGKENQPKKAGEGALAVPLFVSDFPFHAVNKQDYKEVDAVGSTFGNDKILSGKNFRPSFVVSTSPDTAILSFSVRVIEDAIKKLSNTGENKEKTDFFRHFVWFDNFTQSMKTKFNNCVHKKVFYPGAKLIKEGYNDQTAYVIVEGTINLVCSKTAGSRFSSLEY